MNELKFMPAYIYIYIYFASRSTVLAKWMYNWHYVFMYLFEANYIGL